MKRLLLISALLALFVGRAAPGEIHTRKITGAAATVALSSTPNSVHWVQLIAPSGNAANVLWGDALTSATVGTILPAGAGQLLPPPTSGGYDLGQIYAYVAMSDILHVSWEIY